MNKFDLGILLIILICMMIGYYRGFIKSILSVVQYIAIIGLSVYFAPIFSKWLIEKFNLDLAIIDWILKNEELFSGALSFISEEVFKNVVGRVINVFSMLILAIVFKIIFTLIIIILNKVFNLPILSLANRLGGLLFGALNGILVVYLIILLLNWIPLESLKLIREGISSSILGMVVSSCVPEVTSEVIEAVKTSI